MVDIGSVQLMSVSLNNLKCNCYYMCQVVKHFYEAVSNTNMYDIIVGCSLLIITILKLSQYYSFIFRQMVGIYTGFLI